MQRDTEARSRNHGCREKAVTIIHSSLCVCSRTYPACNAHAPYDIALCGLYGFTVFFHGMIFGKTLVITNVHFDFRYNIRVKHPGRIRRDMNVHMSYVKKYAPFSSDFNGT